MMRVVRQGSIALLLSAGAFALFFAAGATMTPAQAVPACVEDCAGAPSEKTPVGARTPDYESESGSENASTGEPAGDSEPDSATEAIN